MEKTSINDLREMFPTISSQVIDLVKDAQDPIPILEQFVLQQQQQKEEIRSKEGIKRPREEDKDLPQPKFLKPNPSPENNHGLDRGLKEAEQMQKKIHAGGGAKTTKASTSDGVTMDGMAKATRF